MSHRLALVGKIICDKGFVDMAKENEKLRLSLFWTRFMRFKLGEHMATANLDFDDGPRCNCSTCRIAKRYEEEDQVSDDDDHTVCVFVPLLEKGLKECGIVAIESESFGDFRHECDPFQAVVDVDAHLVYRPGWFHFFYGAKLAKATSVDDPELRKLRKLFDFLDPNEKHKEPWWMTGVAE
jgi:hypothetical protein